MEELADTTPDAAEHAHQRPHSLNSRVGVAVALSATVMALTNIVGGDVAQEMNLTASEVNNAWAYFQAKSTKQHLAENSRQLLEAFRKALRVASTLGFFLQRLRLTRCESCRSCHMDVAFCPLGVRRAL